MQAGLKCDRVPLKRIPRELRSNPSRDSFSPKKRPIAITCREIPDAADPRF
jgi:hypothetical protein